MLKITVRPSRYLAWLLAAGHAAAIALLWPLAVPLWAKAFAVLAAVASLLYFLLQTALLRLPRAVTALEIRDDGALAIRTRSGEWHECRLSGESFVSPWLTILVLLREDRRISKHIVLVADNTDAGDFRRLRVWLRWAGKRAAEPG